MLKRIQLPSGAIEYVDTNSNLVKATGKKAKDLVKKMVSKLAKTLKLSK